jgi:hypothetical protein
MKKSTLRKLIRESIKQLNENYTGGGCPGCKSHWNPLWCNGTMQGEAAQKWLPPNMNWTVMPNTGCTGTNTFLSIAQQQRTQGIAILAAHGHPSSNFILACQNGCMSNGPNGNYNAISQYVNSLNIPQPDKGKLKRKAAKFRWAMKQYNDCECYL